MTLTLLPSTRLAIRAAIAVSIALVVTSMVHLGHSWWGILTVLLLLAPSWGESIQRSLKRFLMTIIGCSVGWVLYILAGHHEMVHVAVLLMCIFGIMYCMPTWYATAMLFVGILVVFLFGALSVWDGALMWQRVAQTGMGAMIVIIVSGIILPTFSGHNFRQQFIQVLNAIETSSTQLLKQNLRSGHSKQNLSVPLQTLSADLVAIQALYQMVRYEMLFSLRFNKRTDRELVVVEIIGFYLVALHQAFCQLRDDEAKQYFKPVFDHVATHIHRRFEQIHEKLEGKPVQNCPPWEDLYLQDARARFLAARQAQQFMPETFIIVSSCLYYCRRLEAELSKLVGLLRNKGE